MGYCTYYSLSVENSTENFEIYSKRLQEISGFQPIALCGDSCDYIKWRNRDEDMISLSKEYPDVLFILDGNGDDADDIWRAYYQNGKYKYSKADIIYKPFNELEWKELNNK